MVRPDGLEDALNEWFVEAAPRMLVGDWEIKYDPEPPPPDCDAQVSTIERGVAWVNVSDNLLAQGARKQRRVLAHELAHLWLFPISALVESTSKLLGAEAAQLLGAQYEVLEEEVVERCARLMEGQLPLPKLPDPEG